MLKHSRSRFPHGFHISVDGMTCIWPVFRQDTEGNDRPSVHFEVGAKETSDDDDISKKFGLR